MRHLPIFLQMSDLPRGCPSRLPALEMCSTPNSLTRSHRFRETCLLQPLHIILLAISLSLHLPQRSPGTTNKRKTYVVPIRSVDAPMPDPNSLTSATTERGSEFDACEYLSSLALILLLFPPLPWFQFGSVFAVFRSFSGLLLSSSEYYCYLLLSLMHSLSFAYFTWFRHTISVFPGTWHILPCVPPLLGIVSIHICKG